MGNSLTHAESLRNQQLLKSGVEDGVNFMSKPRISRTPQVSRFKMKMLQKGRSFSSVLVSVPFPVANDIEPPVVAAESPAK